MKSSSETEPTSIARPSLDEGLLLEGVVTTTGVQGVNVAPMGPIVDSTITRVLLRPYQTSTTFKNLQAAGAAVLHVTDDVELIARAALHQLDTMPATKPAPNGGAILTGACRWYALEVEEIDASRDRSEIVCRVTDHGRLRDFIGFNRAKHAVLEATILATRLDFLPYEKIVDDIKRLAPTVEKTGGPAERRAFAMVRRHVAERSGLSQGAGDAAAG